MENDLQSTAEKFLSGEEGKRIAGKRGEIERIASSADGQRVRAELERSGFEDAVRRGDTKALKSAMEKALKTDSGAKLLENLRRMMDKK